jgi:hypothetical protein
MQAWTEVIAGSQRGTPMAGPGQRRWGWRQLEALWCKRLLGMLGHWQAPKRSCPTFFFPHDMLGSQKSGNSAQRIKKRMPGVLGGGLLLLLHGIVLRIVSNLRWKDQRAIEQKPDNAACERLLNLTMPGHWLRYTCGWI